MGELEEKAQQLVDSIAEAALIDPDSEEQRLKEVQDIYKRLIKSAEGHKRELEKWVDANDESVKIATGWIVRLKRELKCLRSLVDKAKAAAEAAKQSGMGGGKTSRRKRTKKSRTAGGKKSRKQRKRKTRKCSKRKRRRTCRRR
jgi:hypothetical protein